MKLVVLLNHFPALSETFVSDEVRALRELGHDVRVETGARAEKAATLDDPPPLHVLDEDGLARRLRDLAWLAVRRPGGVVADLRNRRRWAREEAVHPLRVLAPVARRLAAGGERHLHVHFADVAALDALRLSRLTGVSYSVTVHAFEIYRRPTNLPEKLEGAAVAFGVCAPAVADLRRVAPGATVELHELGVDVARFEPPPERTAGRHVIAIGRLVEKKGFTHLLDAAARLRETGRPLDWLTLIGDGPLRAALEQQVEALGLGDTVNFVGATEPAAVPDLLANADVLAMPSVIAADGDRDALPVVVLEALAMGLPVVASDLMGLPEVAREPWGRLVRPGDEAGLADALADVLGRDLGEREAMGHAARAFVLAERDLRVRAGALADRLERLP